MKTVPAEKRTSHAAELKKRDYRIVAEDGVASAGELQRDYEAALEKRRVEFGAAQPTIEALMLSLRSRGTARWLRPIRNVA
jgi:hypothetical protein